MKKLLVLFLLCFFTLSTFAVEYRSVGSNANFCAYTFDGKYYLILSFKDDDENRISNFTIIKFKLSDGTIIKLEGTDGSKQTSTSTVHWAIGISSGGSDDKHFAIVLITPEQIEKLKVGVDKVAINTVPEVYKRSKWTGKEKFGINLYNDFKNIKNEFEE